MGKEVLIQALATLLAGTVVWLVTLLRKNWSTNKQLFLSAIGLLIGIGGAAFCLYFIVDDYDKNPPTKKYVIYTFYWLFMLLVNLRTVIKAVENMYEEIKEKNKKV